MGGQGRVCVGAMRGVATIRAPTAVAIVSIAAIAIVAIAVVVIGTSDMGGVREGALTASSLSKGGCREVARCQSFVHVARADHTVRVRTVIPVRTVSPSAPVEVARQGQQGLGC